MSSKQWWANNSSLSYLNYPWVQSAVHSWVLSLKNLKSFGQVSWSIHSPTLWRCGHESTQVGTGLSPSVIDLNFPAGQLGIHFSSKIKFGSLHSFSSGLTGLTVVSVLLSPFERTTIPAMAPITTAPPIIEPIMIFFFLSFCY